MISSALFGFKPNFCVTHHLWHCSWVKRSRQSKYSAWSLIDPPMKSSPTSDEKIVSVTTLIVSHSPNILKKEEMGIKWPFWRKTCAGAPLEERLWLYTVVNTLKKRRDWEALEASVIIQVSRWKEGVLRKSTWHRNADSLLRLGARFWTHQSGQKATKCIFFRTENSRRMAPNDWTRPSFSKKTPFISFEDFLDFHFESWGPRGSTWYGINSATLQSYSNFPHFLFLFYSFWKAYKVRFVFEKGRNQQVDSKSQAVEQLKATRSDTGCWFARGWGFIRPSHH